VSECVSRMQHCDTRDTLFWAMLEVSLQPITWGIIKPQRQIHNKRKDDTVTSEQQGSPAAVKRQSHKKDINGTAKNIHNIRVLVGYIGQLQIQQWKRHRLLECELLYPNTLTIREQPLQQSCIRQLETRWLRFVSAEGTACRRAVCLPRLLSISANKTTEYNLCRTPQGAM